MSFTVTATQGGATAAGMSSALYVVSGQSASPVGASASAPGLSATITPAAAGSLIYGAVLATSGTLTPLAGTTLLADNGSFGLELGDILATGFTTGSTPLTLGVTSSGGSGISTVLLEILAGVGGLHQFVGSPGPSAPSGGTSVTSSAAAPPAGSLLILLVESNGAAGTTTMGVTDTSGLGLTWTEQVKLNGGGTGYTGIWTAPVPGSVPTSLFGDAPGPGAVSSDAAAAYTLGMQFTLSGDRLLTGIKFFSASGAAALPAGCAIYQKTGAGAGSIVPGTRNDAPSWSGAAGSGWVKCSYDGSVTLTAGTVYKVVVEKQSGVDVYAATGAYWGGTGPGTSGLTSGVISATNDAGGDGGQDTFSSGTSWPTYPASSFNASNYWIDVEVTASAPRSSGLLMAAFP